MKSHKKYGTRHSDRYSHYITSFKVIVKLKKVFETRRKSQKKIFWSRIFGQETSFRIILKLVEVFTNSGKSQKILEALRKV